MKFNTQALDDMSRFQRWVATKALSYSLHEFIALMWPLLLPQWAIGVLLAWPLSSMLGEESSLYVVLVNLFFITPFFVVLVLRRRVIESSGLKFLQFLEDNDLSPNESAGFKIVLDSRHAARFQRITKWGTNKSEIYYSAITVDLGEPVPEIVLDARRNNRWLSSLTNYYRQDQRLHLEGDFNNYFDLYAPVKWRIEALSIMTPDVMQALIKTGYQFDLEVTGGAQAKLIISTPGYIGFQPAKLQALYNAFLSVFPEIEHKLRSLNITTDKPRSFYLNKQEGVFNFSLFGRQVRLYRSLLYIWLSIGIILGVLYLLGVREYVKDMGSTYLLLCVFGTFIYIRLKE